MRVLGDLVQAALRWLSEPEFLSGDLACIGGVRMTESGANSPSFPLLLDRLRQGDEDAARELIDRYGDAVRREIRFWLRDSRLSRVVGESDLFQSAVL